MNRHRFLLAALVLAIASAGAGCGRKGPLYLPDHKPQRTAIPAPADKSAAPADTSTPNPSNH